MYNNTPEGANFIMEAQVRISQYGYAGQGAGIIFRVADENNYYALFLNAADRKLEFRRVVDGGKPAVIAYKNLDGVERHKWYSLKVKAEGENYTFYLDGEEMFTAANSVFTSGKAGLVCGSSVRGDFDSVVLGAGRTFKEMIAHVELEEDLDFDGVVDA